MRKRASWSMSVCFTEWMNEWMNKDSKMEGKWQNLPGTLKLKSNGLWPFRPFVHSTTIDVCGFNGNHIFGNNKSAPLKHNPPQAPTNQLTNGFPQIFPQTKVPCIDVRLMYDSRGFLGKSADLTNRFLIYIWFRWRSGSICTKEIRFRWPLIK